MSKQKMNDKTRIEHGEKKIENNIISRAELLFYMSNLRPAASIRYEGPTSYYYPSNGLSDATISVESDSGVDSCDLLVQADPDEKSLKKAYSELQPGAYLYTECTAAIHSKTAQFINTLYSIGFEEVNIYIPKPEPSHSVPRIFIPLGVPGAIEFLINARYQTYTTNIFKMLAYSFRKLLWRLTPKLFLTYPWLVSLSLNKFSLCSIARKPLNKQSNNTTLASSNHKNETRTNLVDMLKNGWKNWGLGEQPDKLSALVLCRGIPTYDQIMLFVFIGSDLKPTFVIKLPLKKLSTYYNSNEEKVLKILNKQYKRIEGIPDAIFSVKSLEAQIVCQTYISGIPLNNIINRKNYHELALLTTYWLTDFAIETRCESTKDWRDIFIKQVISELDLCIGSILKPDTIETTNKILNEFELPFLVCEHRDFAPVNIILSPKGKLGVVDWEDSRLCGLPALDLIFFLTNTCIDYKLESDTKCNEQSYRNLIDPNTFTGAIFTDCINLYTSELGIPKTVIPCLRLMTWIVQAHISFLDVATGTLKPQETLSEETHLAISLWEEEVLINNEYTE